MFSWVFVVAPWERALRIRMGKKIYTLGPGIYCRIPFIDRVYRQSIRRRISTIRPQTLTTKDNKSVTISGSIAYAIDDLEKLFNTIESPIGNIDAEVASLVATFICNRALKDCSPPAIEEYMGSALSLERYGLIGQKYRVISFVVVKTYRVITGDLPAWSHGNDIDIEK